MSIYNPPSKTQTIFNPSNYGTLGSNGEITIDYLKSSFVEFPVAQGNTTLVGTNVLGNITQQGDFSITGDLLVNDVNVITEIGTKQNELSAGTNISIVENTISCNLVGSTNIDITEGIISTTGLQNELTGGTNISILNDIVSCDLTGSTNIDITDGVISATGLATTEALDDKQDEIDEDTDLTLNSITSNNLTINNNLSVDTRKYFDTIVLRRPTDITGEAGDFILL